MKLLQNSSLLMPFTTCIQSLPWIINISSEEKKIKREHDYKSVRIDQESGKDDDT